MFEHFSHDDDVEGIVGQRIGRFLEIPDHELDVLRGELRRHRSLGCALPSVRLLADVDGRDLISGPSELQRLLTRSGTELHYLRGRWDGLDYQVSDDLVPLVCGFAVAAAAHRPPSPLA